MVRDTQDISEPLISREAEASPEVAEDEMHIDTLLIGSIGEFGYGQQLFYFLTQLAWIPAAFITLVMVFTTLDPVSQRWFSCVEGKYREECLVVLNSRKTDHTVDFCSLPRESYAWTRPHDSIVSEWDLVCGDSWKQEAVNSAFFGGFIIGAGIFGSMSDNLGRKRALTTAMVISGLMAIIGGVSQSYWIFLTCRCVSGIGVAGIGMVAYILGCEYVGPSWRGLLGVAAQQFFAFGAILLPVIAYLMPSWRALSILTGASSLLFPLALLLVPESPRWLLTAGRSADAVTALAAIASHNRTSLPNVSLAGTSGQPGEEPARANLLDVLRHPILRVRLIIQLIAWFTVSSMYYGISLMISALPGSIYVDNVVLAVMEMVAYGVASVLIDLIGRRKTISGSFLIGGLCLILSAATSGPLSLCLAFAAKCAAASAFALVYICMAELFPTVVRNVCVGAASQAARVGSMAMPSLIIIGNELHFSLFGFLVMGLMSTAVGLMLLTQPETLGTVLPETMEDVCSLGLTKPASQPIGQAEASEGFPAQRDPEPGEAPPKEEGGAA
uniref:MFS transporter, OCT family, solute carrier family 22 (Organic cation transporter), member 4/5 n=2 Tax=Tetraselmis sp. GSL018 TaxID=582737 RepID=A0A061RDK7_9CHLO|eukprot:CAMPEP_0177592154 /NCGR_PEP_ID=MMETSP0419_2-20121207/8399_1 /TAXON_ID=582737 /ORGANISM="Tetraselmis sp., Strain GSL018" /LENGTH=556 /DNA_ID=CAMNT_0019082983 /DNA_START=143 /DNA_END=1813 /DNA_ORIENTATION=+